IYTLLRDSLAQQTCNLQLFQSPEAFQEQIRKPLQSTPRALRLHLDPLRRDLEQIHSQVMRYSTP
ncbi:MAG: hypothetical protein OXT67_05105, partial [Zetaproteobacteria bacterium]|nr:hypothetical protein [Zetaproteobacteria bacterium]